MNDVETERRSLPGSTGKRKCPCRISRCNNLTCCCCRCFLSGLSTWVCCPSRKCLVRIKRCCRRHARFMLDMGVLALATFLVVLPLLTLNLRHTALDFLKNRNVTLENKRMLRANTERFNESVGLLKKYGENMINTGAAETVFDINESLVRNTLSATEATTVTTGRGPHEVVKTGLAISVITVQRWAIEEGDPRYLTQTVASLLRLINDYEYVMKKYNIHFSICNVDLKPDRYEEIQSLPSWIPIYSRYQNFTKENRTLYYKKHVIKKEKEDYAHCIDNALRRNLSHVLMIEDDALPRDELFLVLDALILSNFKNNEYGVKNIENVAFYKLYHPERLLGYISIEFERIPELLSLGALLSVILLQMYSKWRKNISTSISIIWFSFFIYSVLLFLIIGRVNIQEIRRLSRYLYQVTPSPSCCTPAMLFSRDGGRRISEFLKTVIDRPNFPKDMAINEYVRKHKLVTRFIQPNLFKHIGHVSSLRPKLLNPYIV